MDQWNDDIDNGKNPAQLKSYSKIYYAQARGQSKTGIEGEGEDGGQNDFG